MTGATARKGTWRGSERETETKRKGGRERDSNLGTHIEAVGVKEDVEEGGRKGGREGGKRKRDMEEGRKGRRHCPQHPRLDR